MTSCVPAVPVLIGNARSLAAETVISKSTLHRCLKTFCFQPHRQKTFKISTDPSFAEKVRVIDSLYLNHLEKAVVLCVNEKTQVQALARTQPLLPIGLGTVEGVTHVYIRHGTTTLFAALDVATGQVIMQCKPRNRQPLARMAAPTGNPELSMPD